MLKRIERFVHQRVSSHLKTQRNFLGTTKGFDQHTNERNRKNMTTREAVTTIPNILTYTRIAASPIMGYCILNEMYTPALACIAYGAATDLLDGFIARQLKQKTYLGQILDPLADKVMVASCFLAAGYGGLVPLWFVKGVIMRDILIIVSGAVIRYFGFEDRPSLKKYFDFERHPTKGFAPTLTSKLNTGLLCGLILTVLSTTHLRGDWTYDNLIFAVELIIVFTSSAALTQYVSRASRQSWLSGLRSGFNK